MNGEWYGYVTRSRWIRWTYFQALDPSYKRDYIAVCVTVYAAARDNFAPRVKERS